MLIYQRVPFVRGFTHVLRSAAVFRNGTFLNGKRLPPKASAKVMLSHGDELLLQDVYGVAAADITLDQLVVNIWWYIMVYNGIWWSMMVIWPSYSWGFNDWFHWDPSNDPARFLRGSHSRCGVWVSWLKSVWVCLKMGYTHTQNPTAYSIYLSFSPLRTAIY